MRRRNLWWLNLSPERAPNALAVGDFGHLRARWSIVAGLAAIASACSTILAVPMDAWAQPAQPCQTPMSSGVWVKYSPRLDFEDVELSGGARLCLVTFDREDVWNVVLTGIANPDHFRAAKSDALERLSSRGFDLCRIAKWDWWGTPGQSYSLADRHELPLECAPRFQAVDPGRRS